MKVRQTTIARRGIAAVEAALVLPVLIVMLAGVWEVARMAEVQQILESAVREGGRQASTGYKNTVGVKADVLWYLERNGVATGGAVVNVTNLDRAADTSPQDCNQLDRYQVELDLPRANVRWVLLPFFARNEPLHAESIWRSMKDIPVNVTGVIPIE